ncbi:hypothetical protein [Ilumatobacter nonamiensis]|uniref:hypothetical protein n=1 Tax=Ilumatobacter nonamiensis TaxID=467093 RepID=UPI0003450EBD|nr:hypothetical protein [Ilumatobacter nonamiensis]
MSDTEDDDTVPTGRSGVDPLIAFPRESSGATGQIERPGDGTPWWFIPSMFAIALGFIALWVVIGESRANDDTDAVGDVEPAAVAATGSADGSETDDEEPAGTTGVADGDRAPAATDPDAPTTIDPRIEDLPPPGVVRVGAEEYNIVAICEVHLPYEPVDTDTEVSSYFFLDGSGARGLVERTVTGDSDTATRALEGTLTSSPDVVAIGDAGAFSAAFVGGEVVVNPPVRAGDGCADRVVTNAPGQFAEPHIQIILDVCIDERGLPQGTTISGFTSEGSGFEIQQAGGELAEIVFERGPDDRLRTTAPATILRTEEFVSASSVVSNGVEDLDITIDMAREHVDAARACTASDRL